MGKKSLTKYVSNESCSLAILWAGLGTCNNVMIRLKTGPGFKPDHKGPKNISKRIIPIFQISVVGPKPPNIVSGLKYRGWL